MFSVKPLATTPFSTGAEAPAAVEQQNGALLGVGSFSQDTLSSGGPVINGAVVVGVSATSAVSSVQVETTGAAESVGLLGAGTFSDAAFGEDEEGAAAAGNVSVNVTGVAATGAVGQADAPGVVSVSVDVTGVEATASAGSVQADIGANVPVTGVEATGQVGQANVETSVSILVTGVQTGSKTFIVTVVSDGYGNIFVIDGVNKPTLNFLRGAVYTFDQSNATNAGHPIAFKDGTGASYTVGVVSTGTPGQVGAQTVITVAANAPDDLRYYCTVHGNDMGNTIAVGSLANTIGTVTVEGTANTLVTGIEATGSIGSVEAINVIDVDLTGVQASGQTGQVAVALLTEVLVTGVQGIGQVVEEPHEWNVKYATAPAGKTFTVAGPSITFANTYFASIYPDGTRIIVRAFVTGPTFSGNGVGTFDLSTPWDISTATYLSNHRNDTPEASTAGGLIATTKSGTSSSYQLGNAGTRVLYNLNDASVTSSINYSGVTGSALVGFATRADDGYSLLKAYALFNDGVVRQFSGGSVVGTLSATAGGFSLSENGLFAYVVGSNRVVSQYSLGTAGDISTAQNAQQSINIGTLAGYASNVSTLQISWKPDGTRFFAVFTNGVIVQYDIAPTTSTVTVISGTVVNAVGVSATGNVGSVEVSTVTSVDVDVTGVSGTGNVGSLGTAGDVNVPVTGVSGTGQTGTLAVEGAANVPVTGVESTGFIGQVDAQEGIGVLVTGVFATGEVGISAVSGAANVPITGVFATGEVGISAVSGDSNTLLTGVESTGFIGQVAVQEGISVLLTGVESTGFIGQVDVQEGIGVPVTGVESTGFVGQFEATGTANVTPTGVVASALLNGVAVASEGNISFDVTGVHGTGEIGQAEISGAANVPVTGVTGTGEVGQAESTIGAVVLAEGVQADGEVGQAQVLAIENVSVDLVGVEASGAVGQLEVDLSTQVFLGSVEGTGQVGQAVASIPTSVDLTGVSATGAIGLVQVGATEVELVGVAATGNTGTVAVTGTCVVDVQGLAAQAQLGTVQGVTAALVVVTGVQAAANEGSVTFVGSVSEEANSFIVVGDVGEVLIGADASFSVTGVSGTGAVGSAAAGNVVDVTLTGLQTVGFVGTVTVIASSATVANVTGVSATGAVGEVLVWGNIVPPSGDGWIPIPTNLDPNWNEIPGPGSQIWEPIAA